MSIELFCNSDFHFKTNAFFFINSIRNLFTKRKHIVASCTACVDDKACVLCADLRTSDGCALKVALLDKCTGEISLRAFKG